MLVIGNNNVYSSLMDSLLKAFSYAPPSADAKMLLYWMLALRPDERATIQQIECHPWLREETAACLPPQPHKKILAQATVSPPHSPPPRMINQTEKDNKSPTPLGSIQ